MEIQDFGEKIGGAKKDLWRERGLSVEDLLDMNEAEKLKLVRKDNIWKKPDYQEMVANGLPIRVAFFVKTIRDATPTKPIFSYLDKSAEKIEEKQKYYVNFVCKLRDFVMQLSTEDDVLNFHNNFMKEYIIHKEDSAYIDLVPLASSSIDNRLLIASQIKNVASLDSEIRKKQFCYSEDEKVLSRFDIHLFDNNDIKFTQDYSKRNVIEMKNGFVKSFLYPKGKFDNPSNWKENTFFITCCGMLVENNFESIDSAEKYILDNFKNKIAEKKESKTRKKNFIPKQLENIIRTGEDYRNGKNITGEDMMKTFNFKGGEFGNWLSDNDRQQSLNYGYDALLDLSKALSISPKDISLRNRLSIAFGSRGSGSFLAHYEPDREVINLTKMKGAGSLAHEWAHALDDITGKQFGLSGFITEKYRSSDSLSKIVHDIVDTMKYKTVSNEETLHIQKEEYQAKVNRLTNFANCLFPEEHLTEEQINKKNELIEKIIDNSETSVNYLFDYIKKGVGNKEIDELSSLRKETIGRVITKADRVQLAHLQHYVASSKSMIGKSQRVKTDFYKNSIIFDSINAKTDHGYWQSTVEMFARSFACYVSDKLDSQSDYLCGHADLAVEIVPNKRNELDIIKAFPEGDERQLINAKIDKLIEFLKEKNLLHDYDFSKENNDYNYDY